MSLCFCLSHPSLCARKARRRELTQIPFFFFRTQNTLEGRRADSSTRESIEALQNSTTQRFEELITLQRDREQREAEEGKQRESREEERLRMDRERHAMEMQKLKMEMTKLA